MTRETKNLIQKYKDVEKEIEDTRVDINSYDNNYDVVLNALAEKIKLIEGITIHDAISLINNN